MYFNYTRRYQLALCDPGGTPRFTTYSTRSWTLLYSSRVADCVTCAYVGGGCMVVGIVGRAYWRACLCVYRAGASRRRCSPAGLMAHGTFALSLYTAVEPGYCTKSDGRPSTRAPVVSGTDRLRGGVV